MSFEASVRPLFIRELLKKKPAIIFQALGVYFGLIFLWISQHNIPLADLVARFGWQILGTSVLTVSFIYLLLSISQVKREYSQESRERRFIDVDDMVSPLSDKLIIEKLIKEIDEKKQLQPSVDYEHIEELIKKSSSVSPKSDLDAVRSFESYFNAIRITLEEKSTVADQKASILLDKGTAYSRGGITFFIISILVWQALSWIKGFETQFIYGIVSCSLLFIFIEFLSAWFLKQYRQFVDTSTYLIKVKSIFDRYMLAYLVLKEASGDSKDKLLDVLPLLKEDIKWPESYLLKSADISFAKETMETMTYLLRTLKETAKESKNK